MTTIAAERQIFADLLIGRPDGETWTTLRDYLSSVSVELGDISGIGTGQSGVDGVVRRMTFSLRNDRTMNVLMWPGDGVVPGDRELPGDEAVNGASRGGEWLSRLLDQEPHTGADGLSPRDRQSAWNQWNGQYAPLLWPNREALLRVRAIGDRETAVGEILAVGDGTTTAFALQHAPLASDTLSSAEFGMSKRWGDFPSTTWEEADFAWNTLFEPADEVTYTVDPATGVVTFDEPLPEGVMVVVTYSYWADDTGWVTLFHGLLGDSIRTSGPIVECEARDLAKRLMDAYITETREYGSEAGTPAEDVIQAIIDDNLGPGMVTLYFPSGTASNPRPMSQSPGFMVTPYIVEYMSVWDAIQQVVAQFGWYLGYRWHPNTQRMQLILMEPPRSKDASTADFHLTWEDDIYAQDLEITDKDIRNIVTVTYRDAATGDRESVTVQDDDSIDAYGPRAMQIEEGDTSLIDTPDEAQRLADAALADLKDMTATTQLNVPLLPTLDVFSGIVVSDPRVSSTDDFYGVESVRHSLDFEAGQFRTEVVAAGRVIGGHHRWLRKQTRPGVAAPPSPEGVVGGGRVLPKPAGLVARGILRGVALDVPVPPVNVNRWAGTEVHLSETQGFTPTEETRVASGKETHFEVTAGLSAGTTYYLRAYYVDLKGNKSPASNEVSAVAGKVLSEDIGIHTIKEANLEIGLAGTVKLGEVVLTEPASSIKFINISQDYRHLIIYLNGRSDYNNELEQIDLRFNDDNGPNYDNQRISASASAASGEENLGDNKFRLGHVPSVLAPPDIFSGSETTIMEYTNDFHEKYILSLSNVKEKITSYGLTIRYLTGFWRNTAPVTSIEISTRHASNFLPGTSFSLYGMHM